MQGPLEGIKVLDLTRVLAGPFCTMLLGDMGAEVVKVERKGKGDDSRALPPHVAGESLYFMVLNRNKQSITLDFRHPRAPSLLRELAQQADVLVENFRAGTMEKMGCGYDALKEINPRLIMVSISGFGQDGPYSQRPCYDSIAQALSGIMELTGDPDGPPTKAGIFISDYGAGLYATIGILSAIRAREQTGVGQWVDISLLDVATSFLITAIPEYLLLGRKMTRYGNRDRYTAPTNVFKTKDGEWVCLSAGAEPFFPKVAQIIGRAELLQDPRFATLEARLEHFEEGEDLVGKWVASKTADEVVALMDKAEVPCAKVASIDEVVTNPQIKHRRMVVEMEHPTVGRVPMQGLTIKFSHTPKRIRRPAPLLGQHNQEVYGRWLGLTSEQVAELKGDGVI